jgi:putative tryptophan/tyrosine transport system substrate-binding protein
MRRREFIAGIGSVAAWPVVGRAQQPTPMRRIGALMSAAADDPNAPVNITAFAQGLQVLGWSIGTNVRIDYRWGAGQTDLYRSYAVELVALKPDVILAAAGSIVGALQQASRTVPIVFVTTVDPVGGGWVDSLSRPGGNATGFTSFEFSMAGKWLELLKEIVPSITRVAVVRDPAVPAGIGEFAAIQTVSSSFRVQLTPIGVAPAEIERGIAAFAREPNGGLIIVGPPSSLTRSGRDLTITLAARHKLPAVYTSGIYINSGGLMSYGANPSDQYRRAASYVDRILKGEKPADLPVQQPSKFELIINLKTAKALGLTIPETLLATADEVIQ